MRTHRLLLLCVVSVGCGGGATNAAPDAELTAFPAEVRPGQPVTLDGSGSGDTDGRVVSWRFDPGDGTAALVTAEPTVDHAYAATGTYLVRLVVTDDRGATAEAAVTIHVADLPPPPECLADDGCPAGDRCLDGRCVEAEACSDEQPCPEPLLCDAGACRCPAGTAQCGERCVSLATDPQSCGFCDHVCPSGTSCHDGLCHSGCAPGWDLCGTDTCHDLMTDPAHCGGCDAPCGDGTACVEGDCAPSCEAGETFCPDGECHDLDRDPQSCGECGRACEEGLACLEGECLAAGTVIERVAAPPVERVTGLTWVEASDQWVLTTGRTFVQFDPWTGAIVRDWPIDNESDRRCLGLAAWADAGGLATGAYDRWDPYGPADLEQYDLVGEALIASWPVVGGPVTSSPNGLWIYLNDTRELIEWSFLSMSVVSRRTVTGGSATQSFTDLANDGSGGLWAVRPATGDWVNPLMLKIDLESATVAGEYLPPDGQGLGGIVLVDGVLWGAGAGGVYRMVP